MGVCAKVRQGQGPAFAVKALPAGEKQGEAFERFLVELQTWLKLSVCDGIVEALCVFTYKDTPVVCSRWMNGGNLRPHLAEKDPEVFYRTIVRIAGALEWAHREHGILHLDLKPENILIDDLHRAAVSDWGIAGTRGEIDPAAADGSMVIYGTAAYASPEQLLGGVPLDVRSDIYSLCCLMYEWETGRVPFTGDWHEIRGAKIRNEPPRLASGMFRRSTFGADDIIMRGLERERHGRYPDWKAFATDVLNASLRRELKIGRFIPKMRYQASEVRSDVLRAKVATGAMVTGRGGSTVDVRGAKKELDEALRFAEKEDWAGAVAILSRVVLPSVVREHPDDPLQQTSAITLARGLLKLDRPAEAVAALDALSAATDKPSEMFALLADAHLQARQPEPRRARGAHRPSPAQDRRRAFSTSSSPRRAPRASRRTRSRRRASGSRGGATPERSSTRPRSSSSRPRPSRRPVCRSGSRGSTRRSRSPRRRGTSRRRTPGPG